MSLTLWFGYFYIMNYLQVKLTQGDNFIWIETSPPKYRASSRPRLGFERAPINCYFKRGIDYFSLVFTFWSNRK